MKMAWRQGDGPMRKWSEKDDRRYDKAMGIREGSAEDVALDKKRGLPDSVVAKGTPAERKAPEKKAVEKRSTGDKAAKGSEKKTGK